MERKSRKSLLNALYRLFAPSIANSIASRKQITEMNTQVRTGLSFGLMVVFTHLVTRIVSGRQIAFTRIVSNLRIKLTWMLSFSTTTESTSLSIRVSSNRLSFVTKTVSHLLRVTTAPFFTACLRCQFAEQLPRARLARRIINAASRGCGYLFEFIQPVVKI